MKLFRSNKLSIEGLRLSLELYRLEKSDKNKELIGMFAKTILYDAMIDLSLLAFLILSLLQYSFPDNSLFTWICISAGVYGLELLNQIVNQYYSQNRDLSCEERARAILDKAPKYIFFNEKEKEIQFKPIVRKIESLDRDNRY